MKNIRAILLTFFRSQLRWAHMSSSDFFNWRSVTSRPALKAWACNVSKTSAGSSQGRQVASPTPVTSTPTVLGRVTHQPGLAEQTLNESCLSSSCERGSRLSLNRWANSLSLPRGSSQGLTSSTSPLCVMETAGATGLIHSLLLQNQRIMRVIDASAVVSFALKPTRYDPRNIFSTQSAGSDSGPHAAAPTVPLSWSQMSNDSLVCNLCPHVDVSQKCLLTSIPAARAESTGTPSLISRSFSNSAHHSGGDQNSHVAVASRSFSPVLTSTTAFLSSRSVCLAHRRRLQNQLSISTQLSRLMSWPFAAAARANCSMASAGSIHGSTVNDPNGSALTVRLVGKSYLGAVP
mmetsp:Transcript_20428/g.57936  ORF Transcript_20428/g.57936 Transcript_20428/m.57936 type:complete len:348 (+) Transcript_20428:705-1748(+)